MTVSYEDSQAAEARGRSLLLRVLNQEERKHFTQTGEIVITGSQGGRYKIQQQNYSGNIVALQQVTARMGDRVREGARLCAHPEMWRSQLPLSDAHVAQILAIKADEKDFLRTAYYYG